MNKILTIIIPTYNMEKYLHKCLDSLIVANENLNYIEVIVINDGSKDHSSQIAHEYESRYPNTFRVVDKVNGNYGSCINQGLKEAKGKYVKILDADDSYKTDVFNDFISYLKTIDTDLVVSNFNIINEGGGIIESRSFHLPTTGTFTLKELSSEDSIWLWHHAITYRLDNLRKLNYRQTEGISYTDEEWVCKPMITVKTISYYPHFVYHYLRGREGQTYDPAVLKKSYSHFVIVCKSLVDFYPKVMDKADNDFTLTYYHCRLFPMLRRLYSRFLFEQTDKDGYDAIAKFDRETMAKCPTLYQELDSLRFGRLVKIRYIHWWRKANYNQTSIYLWTYNTTKSAYLFVKHYLSLKK